MQFTTMTTRIFRLASLAIALCAATSVQVLAQAYEAPLRTMLLHVDSAKSNEILAEVMPIAERIAAANPDAWLPNYYAAHFSLLQYWTAGDEGCDECLDKTDSYLTIAEAATNPNLSEVLTLRASYYQAMLSEHPMRAPYYGPKAGNLLEAAAKADPTNPRAASLAGQNLYYTPAMFGGGEDKARPYLARAVELFEAEEANATRSDLLPRWGAARARSMNAKVTVASN